MDHKITLLGNLSNFTFVNYFSIHGLDVVAYENLFGFSWLALWCLAFSDILLIIWFLVMKYGPGIILINPDKAIATLSRGCHPR